MVVFVLRQAKKLDSGEQMRYNKQAVKQKSLRRLSEWPIWKRGWS